jgi:hypothetical protein
MTHCRILDSRRGDVQTRAVHLPAFCEFRPHYRLNRPMLSDSCSSLVDLLLDKTRPSHRRSAQSLAIMLRCLSFTACRDPPPGSPRRVVASTRAWARGAGLVVVIVGQQELRAGGREDGVGRPRQRQDHQYLRRFPLLVTARGDDPPTRGEGAGRGGDRRPPPTRTAGGARPTGPPAHRPRGGPHPPLPGPPPRGGEGAGGRGTGTTRAGTPGPTRGPYAWGRGRAGTTRGRAACLFPPSSFRLHPFEDAAAAGWVQGAR